MNRSSPPPGLRCRREPTLSLRIRKTADALGIEYNFGIAPESSPGSFDRVAHPMIRGCKVALGAALRERIDHVHVPPSLGHALLAKQPQLFSHQACDLCS